MSNNSPPSLQNFLVNINTSLIKLQQWALENNLIGHPMVQQRMRLLQLLNISDDLINNSNEVDDLIDYASNKTIPNI